MRMLLIYNKYSLVTLCQKYISFLNKFNSNHNVAVTPWTHNPVVNRQKIAPLSLSPGHPSSRLDRYRTTGCSSKSALRRSNRCSPPANCVLPICAASMMPPRPLSGRSACHPARTGRTATSPAWNPAAHAPRHPRAGTGPGWRPEGPIIRGSHRGEYCISQATSPAAWPDAQAHWKLKPPRCPVTSTTSPIK